MRQQINLFQPILREGPKMFGARAALATFGTVLGALVLIWGFGMYKVQNLEKTTQSLREQQVNQEKTLETASTMSAARATPVDLAARVKRTEEEVVARTRALDLLRTGAAGRTTGFAARLQALARRHVDGVWIDRMALSGSSEAMSIGGATFDPDLVPRYLQSLARDNVLAGARFDELAIERPHDKPSAQVRFLASSLNQPMPALPAEDGGAT